MRESDKKDRQDPGGDDGMEEKKADDTAARHHTDGGRQQDQHDQQVRDERSKSPASTSARSVASSISSLGAGTASAYHHSGMLTTATSPQNHMTKTVTKVIQELLSSRRNSRQGRGGDDDGRPANALRKLFALSEHASQKDNRVALVHANDGQLVPVLLHFLEETCRENGTADAMSNTPENNNSSDTKTAATTATTTPNRSAEQYLALLVLNNLCTAPENKRLIALEHDGAKIISSLLFDDPSCHLLAIILVNLTFSDAKTRQELIAKEWSENIHMVESLAFCMRVASLTLEEYEARQPFLENANSDNENRRPLDLLRALLQEDWRLSNGELAAQRATPGARLHETLPDKPLFPDTARYCLVALKNLTRCFGRMHATCISHTVNGGTNNNTASSHGDSGTTTATATAMPNHTTTTSTNVANTTTAVGDSNVTSTTTTTTAMPNHTTTTSTNVAKPTTSTNVAKTTTAVGDNNATSTTTTPAVTTALSSSAPPAPTAAQVLIRTGIVPHILRYITIADEAANPKSKTAAAPAAAAMSETDEKEQDTHDDELEDVPLDNNTDSKSATAPSLKTASRESTSEESVGSSTPNPPVDSPTTSTSSPDQTAATGDKQRRASVTIMTEREEHDSRISNSPSRWDANSAADAALFCILNLAAVPSAREYLREVDTIKLLTWIVMCGQDNKDRQDKPDEATKLLDFQCTKAHIALAYLIGSEGHFGQPMSRRGPGAGVITVLSSGSFSPSNGRYTRPHAQDAVCLNLSAHEPLLFVELLANTMHGRGKTGPGGYSPATISTKFVLYAIRCLLTQHFNQTQFALKSSGVGVKLNVLLMKILAWHAVSKTTKTVTSDCPDDVNAEAAEYAVFSLYLMSNHGVKSVFLPGWFGHDEVMTKSLAAKILASYALTQTVTSPGKHAVEQLLLRLKYLSFGASEAEPLENTAGARLVESDYTFSDELLRATTSILVPKTKPGARPRPDIFDRPILRTRVMRKSSIRSPWDNSESVDYFPSVLVAVQELSFNSSKVRHLDAIDDFQIANNISNSANGEKTESYNHLWSWEDTATEIHRNLDRVRSTDSYLSANSSRNNNVAVIDLSSLCICGDLSAVV